MSTSERTIPKAGRIAFLGTEIILYILFLFLDLTGRSAATTAPKYLGILLCVAFSLWCAAAGGDWLIPPALILTAAADCFLLVLDRYYALGTFIFLGAQLIYLIRIRRETGRTFLWLRVLLPCLTAIVLLISDLCSPLNLLAVLYFSQLVVNALLAWTAKGEKCRLFAIGLSLFVGCDLCVGIRNASVLFPLALVGFARVGMWMFYLPSQVLITLSALPASREGTQ